MESFDHGALLGMPQRLLQTEAPKAPVHFSDLRLLKKYANSKSNYEFSSSVIYVNNISVENAKKFAEELYDVINTIVG